MKKFRYSMVALLAGVALVGAACSDDDDNGDDEATTTTTTEAEASDSSDDAADTSEMSITEIAASNEDFETLVAAVTAAGLDETLAADGTYTVFAPTDEAFDALPEGTVDSLLEDPQGALTDVLTLHVLDSEVDAAAATAAVGTCVESLGGSLKVDESADGLTVGGALVVTTDIEASNGIIHVIDSVITEPSADC